MLTLKSMLKYFLKFRSLPFKIFKFFFTFTFFSLCYHTWKDYTSTGWLPTVRCTFDPIRSPTWGKVQCWDGHGLLIWSLPFHNKMQFVSGYLPYGPNLREIRRQLGKPVIAPHPINLDYVFIHVWSFLTDKF